MLYKALERKKRQHAKVHAPLIIAVLGMSTFLDDEDVAQALFGSEAVVIDTGQAIRRPDGFWRGGNGPSAKDVTAVLIGKAIYPWTITQRWPRLWFNPWANSPLEVGQFPFPHTQVDDERLTHIDVSWLPDELFGLDSEWPGDAGTRFNGTH